MTHQSTAHAEHRGFGSSLRPEILSAVQRGVMKTRYRGRQFWKSPFDVVLYLQLLQDLQPGTVLEIGSKAGGSALWFADQTSALGHEAAVVSVDLEPPSDVSHPRVRFLRGDARALEETLTIDVLSSLPKPWLVSEDSAHTFDACIATLEFFHPFLAPGDYIVIEDGIVAELPGAAYAAYDNGPNRAVETFLNRHGAHYEIDAALCDFFGRNATWNPNGWLRRR